MSNRVVAKRVELQDGPITYAIAGEGPVLLLLHGLSGNSMSWIQQLQTLSVEFTVVAWDAPGYGGSAGRAPDPEAYASAAARFIDALGAGPITVIGHSMGGIVAGRLTAQRPDLVSMLVLSSTFVGNGASPDEPLSDGFQKRIDELNTLERSEFALARAMAMVAEHTAPQIVQMVADVAAKVNADGFINACKMLNCADNTASLQAVRLPVLILEADEDPIVSRNDGDTLAELVRHAERHVLRGIGHAAYLEAPQQYNQAVIDFFRRHSAR